MRAQSVMVSAMEKFWWWLRQVTGDAAYENYLGLASRRSRNPAICHPHNAGNTVSAEQFYVERMQRKYARISRCC
jgi:hypothetical protein